MINIENRNKWTDEELDIIKNLYPFKSNLEISKIVNHSKDVIKSKGIELRLKKQKYWNKERKVKLIEMFPKVRKEILEKEFPEKKWDSIRNYARIQLGLHRQVQNIFYTNEEIKLLRKVYPICSKEEILPLFPKRSWTGIYAICNDLKIKRKIIANLKITKFSLGDKERGYIAGMIDGEGSLYFRKKGGSLLIHLSIVNTNLECLEYIKNILKCGYIRKEDRRGKHPHYKIAYKYELNKQGEILGLLNEIKDLLIIKRERYYKFLNAIERWSNRERSNIRHYLVGKIIIPQTRRVETLDKREKLQELYHDYYSKQN